MENYGFMLGKCVVPYDLLVGETEEADLIKIAADTANLVNEQRKRLDRAIELYELERQGRLVVLPCKVGDTVYTNCAMSGWYFRAKDRPYPAKVVFYGLNGSEDMGGGLFNVVYEKNDYMMQFRFSDIGKTVFLTREEAEKALKEDA